MPRRKLKQFKEIQEFPNVFENTTEMKGKWNDFFKNDHPIVLELGCGKGEYTSELAQKFPDNNYIGIDKKGNRIWTGAKTAIEHSLKNVAFLRADIAKIDQYFEKSEISEIWITFSDPFPKDKHEKHRLTQKNFLLQYKKILKENGVVHLKTDSKLLFDYTKESISTFGTKLLEEIQDIYARESIPEKLQIQTTYEKKHLKEGRKIYYLRFTFS